MGQSASRNLRWAAAVVLLSYLLIASSAQAADLARLRAHLYRTDVCLAELIDREQGGSVWSATVYNGGGHWHPGERFDTSRAYGLGQAYPGTKMASAGADWRTNVWTQLRWTKAYIAERYNGSCMALAHSRALGFY